MSVTANIESGSSKRLANLKKRMESLVKLKIQSGHFQDSGMHPTAEMTYPELAFKLSVTYPQRDLRIGVENYVRNNQQLKSKLKKKTKNYLYDSKPLIQDMTVVATDISEYAQSLFGVPSSFNPSNSFEWANYKNGDTPLVHEGYLKASWTYKILQNGNTS